MTKMRDPRLYDLKYDGSKEFGAIYSQLSSDNTSIDVHPRTRYFTIRRDQLFYRHADGSLALCVPEGHFVKNEKGNESIPLREALVRECHNSPYMGHRGANKTYLQVRRLFYWKGLPNYVNRYVASCKTCQRAKASTRGRMGALHPNEIPSAPMHSITMDFISGLPLVDGVGDCRPNFEICMGYSLCRDGNCHGRGTWFAQTRVSTPFLAVRDNIRQRH